MPVLAHVLSARAFAAHAVVLPMCDVCISNVRHVHRPMCDVCISDVRLVHRQCAMCASAMCDTCISNVRHRASTDVRLVHRLMCGAYTDRCASLHIGRWRRNESTLPLPPRGHCGSVWDTSRAFIASRALRSAMAVASGLARGAARSRKSTAFCTMLAK